MMPTFSLKAGRRLALAAALGLSTALPAAALDLEAMSASERVAFGEAVKAYLLENPQVLMEALQVLEDRQAADQAAADEALVASHAGALFNDGYSWVGGNPDGDITIVEFIDYRCGYCRRAHPEVAELVASDGNIRLIVKEFPILGEASLLSSRFAVATRQVAGDAAYKTVHDALVEMRGDVSEDALARIGEAAGIDVDAVLVQMNSDEVRAELVANRALAEHLGINGTPTFVVGNELLRGYLPLEGMRQVVAQERAEG